MLEDLLHELPVHIGALPLAEPQAGVKHVILKDQAHASPTK
jgi:hypothetical protein